VSEDALLPVGTSITARHFAPGQYIDVQGTSKGKGFQGVMRRWGFKGQPASHGHSLSHRSAGSSGGAAGSMYATRVFKGKKMAGRMGGRTRTVFSLQVYKIDEAHNILYLRGSVPGNKGSVVRLIDATRKFRAKGKGFKLLVEPPFPTFLPGDLGDGEGGELVAQAAAKDPLRLTGA